MREMAERPINNEKKADDIRINPARTEDSRQVRIIQKAKPQNLCYKKSEGQGKYAGSCSQEFLADSKAGFDINNWGLPALDLEQFEDNIKGETGVADESKGSICYAWIGAGQ